MGCAVDTIPARCQHPVIRGQLRGNFLWRDCDDYPCGMCGEDIVFLCGEGVQSCGRCSRVAEALCDFPIGHGQTCDIPLCSRHRIAQGGDVQDMDFCPQHALIARQMVTGGEGEE